MNREEKYKIVFGFAKKFLKNIVNQHPELDESILAAEFKGDMKFDNIRDDIRALIRPLSNRMASVINFIPEEDQLKSILCGYDPQCLELDEPFLLTQYENDLKFNDIRDANEILILSGSSRYIMYTMTPVFNITEKEDQTKSILCDYEPQLIIERYRNADKLSDAFKSKFKIKNVQSSRNIWRKFSEGIISGSRFMAAFKDKDEFDSFIKTFSYNKYTKAALPMLLSREIQGLGFALACNFLFDLGYRDFPRPDEWSIRIFNELDLSDSADPYEVYKTMIEMSEAVGEDVYNVDKIFWMISSGWFPLVHANVGRKLDEFIYKAKALF